jgi:hypothetical protein
VRHRCATGPSWLLGLLTSVVSPLGLDGGPAEDQIATRQSMGRVSILAVTSMGAIAVTSLMYKF